MIWRLLLLVVWSSVIESSHCMFGQSWQEPPQQLAFAAPPSFGKTHFIRGHSDCIDLPRSADADKPSVVRCLFSPDDEVKKELIYLIDHEQKRIQVAVFFMTEPEIAQALCRAKKRGVEVELITDVGCLKERANKINVLCDNGCKLYVYHSPTQTRSSSIMHHKFALFFSSSTLWTGSYNFTKAASSTNQENAVIISDKKAFDRFAFQFKRLKERSYRYGKSARA